MKKTNKKQIPKVRLPKYSPGGSHKFNESMYDSSQDNSTQGTKDAYNEKRSKGLNAGQYAQIGLGLAETGKQMNANQSLQGSARNEADAQALNSGADAVGGILPWYGMAKSAEGMGKSFLKKDEYGNYKGGMNKAANEIATPDHEQMLNDIAKKNYSALAWDSTGMGKFGRMASDLTGNSNKTTGGWGKINKMLGVEPDSKKEGEFKAQQEAANQQQMAAQQQQTDFINNAVQSGMANYNQNNPQMQGGANNTIQYAKYGGQMKFAMGGINKYPGGGNGKGTGQVELDENSVAPNNNNKFTQFDELSHNQQDPNQPNASLDSDEMVFTARFGPNGKKGPSWADLNKPNNTNREDKLLKDDTLSKTSALSLNLTKMAKVKNSYNLFYNGQEAQKEQMASSAFNRMVKKYGVPPQLKNLQPSRDNESMEQGQSEQSEGEMPMVKYGGRFALGGVQLPYYNTDRNGNPKYTMGGFNDDPTLTPATTSTVTPTPTPTPVKLLTDFESRNKFDTYMKSQPGYARDPRNKSGVNVGYYPTSKYKYNEGTNTFSNIGDTLPGSTTVNFGSIPSSDFIEYTPKIGRPTPTANWQTNQLLRGGGNKLTFPSGDTQIVAPKKVLAYGGKMPKYSLGGEEDTPVGNIPTNFNFERTKAFNREQNQRNLAFNQMTGNKNPGFSTYNSDYENALQQTRDEVNAQQNKTNPPQEEEELQLANDVIDKQHGWDHKNPKTAPGYKKQNLMNNIDWSKTDKLGNLFNFIGQNAGNIYNLSRYNKPEIETYAKTTGKYITPDFRDANQKYLWAKEALGNVAGGHGGAALANIQKAHVDHVMNKAQIQQTADNTNAQIGNQVNQFNTELAYRETIANAQNRARNRSGKGEAIGDIGQNFGVASKAGKQGEMDQKTLALIMKYYNIPEFQKMMKDNKFT